MATMVGMARPVHCPNNCLALLFAQRQRLNGGAAKMAVRKEISTCFLLFPVSLLFCDSTFALSAKNTSSYPAVGYCWLLALLLLWSCSNLMNSSDDNNFNDLLQIYLQKKMRSLLSLELADYLTAVWVSNGNNKNNNYF